MKAIYIIALMGLVVLSCTDKRTENSIKNLEKRVAALEKKSGVVPAGLPEATMEDNTPSDPTTMPVMVFDNTEYDFGTVSEGDVVEYTFKFKNVGAMPLVISQATATCGCTVPVWPKEPIAAGGEGVISVKFNTTNKPNQQTKYVNISANTKPEVTRLKISGMVNPKDKTK